MVLYIFFVVRFDYATLLWTSEMEVGRVCDSCIPLPLLTSFAKLIFRRQSEYIPAVEVNFVALCGLQEQGTWAMCTYLRCTCPEQEFPGPSFGQNMQ
jgi:hypothetical protein